MASEQRDIICNCPDPGHHRGTHCRAAKGFRFTSDDWCGCACHRQSQRDIDYDRGFALYGDHNRAVAFADGCERGRADSTAHRLLAELLRARDVLAEASGDELGDALEDDAAAASAARAYLASSPAPTAGSAGDERRAGYAERQEVRAEERVRAAAIVREMSRYGGTRALERAEAIAEALIDAEPSPEECARVVADLGIDIPELAKRLRKQVSDHFEKLRSLPICADCPIGGRETPGAAVCPRAALCDEECCEEYEPADVGASRATSKDEKPRCFMCGRSTDNTTCQRCDQCCTEKDRHEHRR